MNVLGKAIALSAKAFEGIMDSHGEPYILHNLYVMYRVSPHNRVRAMLHDYVEDIYEDDHEAGYAFLRSEGIPEDDVRVIKLLTHKGGDSYMDVYIKQQVASDKDAIEIKMADLKHNTKPSRLKSTSEKHLAGQKKYLIAFNYLHNLTAP